MAKAAATLLALLSCLWSTVQDDPHILRCSFTLKTRSIRTESIPQCSVDGVPLHPYDKDNTRKEGNAPKECAELFPKLKDIEQGLRSQLHIMKREGHLTRGDHSLLVTAVSLYKEGQPIYGYWNFTLDGQHFFGFNCFDSKNKTCVVTPNNTPGIDKWQNNINLVQDLATFISGDSRHCFPEILPQLKKMPNIGNVTSPSQLPSTKQPPSKEGSRVTEVVNPIIVILSSVFVCICICICIYKCVKRKSHPQGGEMCCKLYILDSCICGNRRGEHTPSAVGEPCPEESISMTVMSPLEGASPCCSSASSVI